MKCNKTSKDGRLFALNCNKTKNESSNFKQKAYKHKPNKRAKCNDGNVGLYQLLNTMIRVR